MDTDLETQKLFSQMSSLMIKISLFLFDGSMIKYSFAWV